MPKDTQWSKGVLTKGKAAPRTRLRQLLDNVLVQFLAFGAFIGAMVAIMTAGFDVRDRALNEAIIGQVAPFTIEASRDFSFTEKDVVASMRLREEVAEAVPSVFDWQESLGERIRDDVRKAFSSMRQAMAEEIRAQLEESDPERYAELVAQSVNGTIPARVLIDTANAERRARLAYGLRADHFTAHLGVNVADADFEAFARRGFAVEIENALAAVVSEAMSNLIVANLRRIERESEHGIYLRRLRDDKLLIEYHVTDLDDRFVGLDSIPRQVEEAARREILSINSSELRQAILSTAMLLVRPNTTFNEARTLEKRKAARDSVADQILSEEFRKGQIIVDKGHIVTERHFRIIQTMLEHDEGLQRTQILAGIAVFCLLLLMTLFVFGRKNVRRFQPRPKDIVFMGSTLLLMLLLTRMGTAMSHAIVEQSAVVPIEAWYFAIPVAAGGMLIRLVLNSEHAIIFTILFAILVGIIADTSLFFAAYTAMGTLVGITTVQHVKHRMALMWSGLAVGVVNAAVIIAFLLIQGELFQFSTLLHVALGFGGGLAAGFFISAVLPLFEAVFSYTTDIKLLELANLNHPLLRELILRAPGSYHHSMMVGSLCEAASEAIGCNPLLARVGAYYHDIGKAKNPQYFAENQRVGENPHDRLKPNMSALIIKSHVKDGLDMARQHRLPIEIQDFITQHHGTSLIAFFYHRAKEQEDPDIPEVDEKDYRYPGPRPQSREIAICLLADSIEAASRSLPNPSPARLKGLVQTMINRAFTDGQLDECDLTLKDLNSIAKAFTRILTGIYHHRPEYPGQSKKDGEKDGQRTTQELEGGRKSTTQKTGRARRTTGMTPGSTGGSTSGIQHAAREATRTTREMTRDTGPIPGRDQRGDAATTATVPAGQAPAPDGAAGGATTGGATAGQPDGALAHAGQGADASSDVWEIAADSPDAQSPDAQSPDEPQTPQPEATESAHAGGDHAAGKGRETPSNQGASSDDLDERRQALPRLGTT